MKLREPLSSEDETQEPIGKLQAADNSVFASRWELFTPYIAEYWGTLVVTATFLCNVDVDQRIDPSFKSICQAFMVVGMVSATKHITGSSLNPSVSLALALAGRQRIRTAGFLCIAQILGAITAVALCCKAGIGKDFQLGPILGHNWFQVALLETTFAAMMCIVYLNCAASTKNNPKGDQNGFVGLSYGFCYLASHNAASGVCRTVSNSAISIGLIVWAKSDSVSLGQGLGYFFYDLPDAGLLHVQLPERSYGKSKSFAHSIHNNCNKYICSTIYNTHITNKCKPNADMPMGVNSNTSSMHTHIV
ncbi:NIP1-1 [Symbiodinium natans]|uniref:NIP1-1 protein n=1 Tax=Symbiodinium natans TaxID=878477 RepID=A0A812Q622_9DINO|nr:NIP1-1 [Symbiodinium natans]